LSGSRRHPPRRKTRGRRVRLSNNSNSRNQKLPNNRPPVCSCNIIFARSLGGDMRSLRNTGSNQKQRKTSPPWPPPVSTSNFRILPIRLMRGRWICIIPLTLRLQPSPPSAVPLQQSRRPLASPLPSAKLVARLAQSEGYSYSLHYEKEAVLTTS
jgi:hypothetical protein